MGLSHFFKQLAKTVSTIDPFSILPEDIRRAADKGAAIVAGAVNPALGAAITGAQTYGETGKLLPSLGAAGGSYLGSQIGSSFLGDLGTVGGTIGTGADAIGGAGASNALGDFYAKNLAGTAIGGIAKNALQTPISSIVGNYIGSNLGQSLTGAKNTGTPVQQSSVGLPTTTPFTPTRASDEELSPSLQGAGFGALDPLQRASGLATQGVYGGGLGPQEQSYFTKLINRQLIEPTGNIKGLEELNPIENSYLSQLGLGGAANSNSLLEMLSKWKAA